MQPGPFAANGLPIHEYVSLHRLKKKTRPADEKDVPLYNCLSAKVLCKYPALLLALLFGMEAFYFPLCRWVWTRLTQ